MKKIASFLFFFTLLALSAQAQMGKDGKGFRFGFQASPTFSKISTNDKLIESAGSPNTGLKLGVMGENYFSPNYAFVTGVGFGFNQGGTLQNGYSKGVFWGKSDLSAPNLDTLSKNSKMYYRTNFVEIPFGLKMKGGSNEDSRIKFYAEAPVFTLGFVTKAIGGIRGTQNQDIEDENIRPSVNGLSLSWGLGAGIEYEVATGTNVVAGIAYQKQFTDFTDDNGSVLPDGSTTWKADKSKGTLGVFTLRIGVFF
jgi:Outer membrane protein beta-barrel domain